MLQIHLVWSTPIKLINRDSLNVQDSKERSSYLPLNLRTKFLKLKTTPYTSLASSSNDMLLPGAAALCMLEIRLLSSPALYEDAAEELAGLLSTTLDVALDVEYREVELSRPPVFEDVVVLVALTDAIEEGR